MEKSYKVIFTGQLQTGIEKLEAIKNVSTAFKITEEKANELISADKAIVIKNNLPYQSALEYKRKLSKTGLHIELHKVTTKLPGSPVLENPEIDLEDTTQLQRSSPKKEIGEDIDSLYSAPKSNLYNTTPDKMGFVGLLVRFTLFYVLTTIGMGIIINIIGIKNNSGTGVAVILLSTMLACTTFAKKNNRYLSQKERVKATIGFSVINIVFQLTLALLLFIGLAKTVTLKVLFIILLIPIFIHTPIIYFFIWTNMKRMAKRGEIPA